MKVNEELNKSIDSLIDDLFAEETAVEVVEKAEMIQDDKPQEEVADEAMKKVPSSEDDAKRNAGRPKQISDVPKIDMDGKREADYDAEIAEKNEDGKTKEQDQVKPTQEMMKKSWEETAEYKEYQALKKAKEESEATEKLEKTRKEQTDLIKSAIAEATEGLKGENALLKKSLDEQAELLKAIANKPQRAKAITNINAVERFQKSEDQHFSKADLLDVAEDLVKAKKLEINHVIELEQTGRIYDSEARRILESAVRKQK